MDSNLLLLALEVKKLKKEKSAPPVPVKGEQGDKGDTGETGARGADGLDGAKGDKGDKGDAGKDGSNGADGVSVVDAEVDIDGTLAFSLSNGETIKTSGEVVGPKGPPGMQGAAGVGIAAAGTTGQVLTKASNDNYDTVWTTISSSGTGTVTSVATTGTVNGITLTGGPITSTGTVTLGGTLDLSSPPAIGGTTPAAGSFTTLIGGAGSANYEQITGGATTKAVQFQTLGTDANIPLAVQTKGTGAISLAAGSQGINISNGGTVTAITTTNSGGGTYTSAPSATITTPTTAGGVQATAQVYVQSTGAYTIANAGIGYTTGDTITFSGGTGTISATATVTASAGVITAVSFTAGGAYTVVPTNPVSVTGGTGSGATFNLTAYLLRTSAPTWNITNAGSGYVEQPTVTFSGGGGSGATAYATVGTNTPLKSVNTQMELWTPQGRQLIVGSPGQTGATYAQIQNDSASRTIFGGSNTTVLTSGGTTNIQFTTNNTAQEQLRVSHTASAVNYVQVTGAATGASPTISAQGSDASVNLTLNAKNSGSSVLFQVNGLNAFQVSGTGSLANRLRANGALAGASPVLDAVGSDTNIDLSLTPKGTGNIRFGTYTASVLTPTGYIEIKDSGGTLRRLLVG